MFSPITTLYTYFPLQFYICLTIDLLIVAFGVVFAIMMRRKGRFDKAQLAACIVLFVWAAFVLFLTVLGRRMHTDLTDNYNLELFSCYRHIFLEHSRSVLKTTLQNILMFIPVGFTLSAVFKNKHKVIIPLIISFAFSLMIEVSQLLLKSGFFELDDLFNNTLGALVGILIYLIISKIYRTVCKKEGAHHAAKRHR